MGRAVIAKHPTVQAHCPSPTAHCPIYTTKPKITKRPIHTTNPTPPLSHPIPLYTTNFIRPQVSTRALVHSCMLMLMTMTMMMMMMISAAAAAAAVYCLARAATRSRTRCLGTWLPFA